MRKPLEDSLSTADYLVPKFRNSVRCTELCDAGSWDTFVKFEDTVEYICSVAAYPNAPEPYFAHSLEQVLRLHTLWDSQATDVIDAVSEME